MAPSIEEFLAGSEVSEVTESFVDIHKFIHGWPKSGKTSIAAAMIDGERTPYFILTERGLTAIKGRKNYLLSSKVASNGAVISPWQDFKRVAELLVSGKETFLEKHSCLVIDVINEVYGMCSVDVCRQNQILHPSDLAMGKAWDLLKYEFRKTLSPLLNAFPCVFLCHTADKLVTYNGTQMTIQNPDMPKGGLAYVTGKCDVLGYIKEPEKASDSPRLTFTSAGRTSMAGSRFRFMQREFELDPADLVASYIKIKDFFEEQIKKGQ